MVLKSYASIMDYHDSFGGNTGKLDRHDGLQFFFLMFSRYNGLHDSFSGNIGQS